MKYQDFPGDENFLSSEDTIFVFLMWRYRGCHDYLSLSQWDITITASCAFIFFILKSVALKTKLEFSINCLIST